MFFISSWMFFGLEKKARLRDQKDMTHMKFKKGYETA
jgi:hypothetical protein